MAPRQLDDESSPKPKHRPCDESARKNMAEILKSAPPKVQGRRPTEEEIAASRDHKAKIKAYLDTLPPDQRVHFTTPGLPAGVSKSRKSKKNRKEKGMTSKPKRKEEGMVIKPNTRPRRAVVAKETLEIIERGYYRTVDEDEVSISEWVRAAVESTVLYELCTVPPLPEARFNSPCSIEVTNETTLGAVQRASRDSDNLHHVGCLNFASANKPGGGFKTGAQAQEEALARSGALYPCLMTQYSPYYEANRAFADPMYLNLAIASPRVPFFRDDDARLLSMPVLCTVITCPAPNARRIPEENSSEIESVLTDRAGLVLRSAALQAVDTLVLGAWGCGVFGNDPEMVARIFWRWLSPGMEYERQFNRVIFAIPAKKPNDNNVAAFSRVFHRMGM